MSDKEISTIKEELLLGRERYHKLSNELNTVKCRTEILENSLESLRELEKSVLVLKTEVFAWIEGTNEYRTNLNKKFDGILKFITDLPCKERAEDRRWLNLHLAGMWASIVAIAVIGLRHLGLK
jgi:hypothetical protein